MPPFELIFWILAAVLVLLAVLGALNLALRQRYLVAVRARPPTEQAAFIGRSRRTLALTRAAILMLFVMLVPLALVARNWRPSSFLPVAVAWLLLVANVIEIYCHRKWLASRLEETRPTGDQGSGAA